MEPDLSNLQRVPVSKFRRELKKWIRIVDRTGDPIVITQRNGPELVLIKYVDIYTESVYSNNRKTKGILP
jgi:prevent-host-death family protein